MEDNFKVIDNYLMVKMPEEVDHHKSVYISKTADEYIMNEGVGNGQLRNRGYYWKIQENILLWRESVCNQYGYQNQENPDDMWFT